MAPTNTRQSKTAKPPSNDHDISNSSDSDGEKEGGGKTNPQDPMALSENQLETVSLLVKSAVAAAVAQVLPLANLNNHNASGFASPGTSAQPQNGGPYDQNKTRQENDEQEDGEVKDEELDEYERELQNLLGDAKITGPEISDKISRLLERCLGNPLDEKVVKLKRDAYPRPENVNNLKVPRTNPLIFAKISSEHQGLDRAMQVTQSYLASGITAVGIQAEKLLGLRTWANGLESDEKENLPEQIQQLTGIYVHLMDSLILLIRTMSDLTSLRRRMIRNDLVEPYKSLMEEEKNPPTPDWLGGDDVPAAIRKAKANAGLADDIAKRGKWPKKGYYKNSRFQSRPYDAKKAAHRREDSNSNRGGHNRQQSRGRGEGYRNNNDNRNRQDFYRRDSR